MGIEETTALTRTELQNRWKQSITNKELKHAVDKDGPRHAFGKYADFIRYVRNVYRPATDELLCEWNINESALRSNVVRYNLHVSKELWQDLVDMVLTMYSKGATLTECQETFCLSFQNVKWIVQHVDRSNYQFDPTLEQAKQWWIEKHTYETLANQYHVSKQKIKQGFDKAGIKYDKNLIQTDILQVARQGTSPSHIAQHFNVNKSSVKNWLSEWGFDYSEHQKQIHEQESRQRRLEASKRGGQIVKAQKEQRYEQMVEQIVPLVQQGFTNEQIGEKVGVTDLTVAHILQHYDIAYRTREQRADELSWQSYANAMANLTKEEYDYTLVTYEHWKSNTGRLPITCPTHGVFWQTKGNHFTNQAGCPKCANVGPSKAENQIAEYIRTLGFDVEQSNRALLGVGKKELDIIVPSSKLAIEYNGLYWHSSSKDTKDNKHRHISKTNRCEELGWQLLHVNSDEWEHPVRSDIWKSIIASKLGVTNRIWARQTTADYVQPETAKEFLRDNHMQGEINGTHVGLYYYGQLVMVLTYGKGRFDREAYEILRVCPQKYNTVVGGMSKLLKHMKHNLSVHTKIVSYTNRRWSRGNAYHACWFEQTNITKPNYVYVKDGHTLLNRLKCQKHKLPKILGNKFDPALSEKDNMLQAGFQIMYDCGNIKFCTTT